MTWWNWCRISPRAPIPAGQCTINPLRVPPQCDAIRLVHWYGVSIAWRPPQRILRDTMSGVPNVSRRSRRNCGVSTSVMPVMVSDSFQVPLMVPSPEAPLSPVMT